jgi:predicted protein tyrosine phosphatase
MKSTSTLTERAKKRALRIQQSLDSPYNTILPFLFLGSDPRKHAKSKNVNVASYLASHKFTHRVDLTSHPIDSPKLPTFFLTVHDEPSSTSTLFNQLDAACDFIDAARKEESNTRILIHCKAGVSRSATLVLYYLLTRANMNLNLAQALEVVRVARPIVSPNHGFMRALCSVERKMNLPASIDPDMYEQHRFGNKAHYLVMV